MVETEDFSGLTYTSDADSSKLGLRIEVNVGKSCTLVQVTKDPISTATVCYLWNASKEEITTAAFVGDDATFSQALTAGTTYYVVMDKEGAANTYARNITSPYPIAGTNITYTAASTDASNRAFNIKSVTTDIAAAGTQFSINVLDAWKEVSAIKINIGDVWKEVAAAKINVGDSWKEVF